MTKVSPDEAKWRAESDANTLARAEEIRSDRQRHAAAIGHAKKEAEKYQKIARRTPAPAVKSARKK